MERMSKQVEALPWGTPWMHSRIRCFKSLVLAGLFFAYLAFDVAPKEVFCYRKIRRAGGLGDVPKREMSLTGKMSWWFAWKSVLCEQFVHLVGTTGNGDDEDVCSQCDSVLLSISLTVHHSAFSKTQRPNKATRRNCTKHYRFWNMQKM